MKTFLKIIGIGLVLVILAGIGNGMYLNGVFNTKFWGSHPGWDDFQNGVYYCGKDIQPGSYDIIVRNPGSVGMWHVFENPTALEERDYTIGDLGNLRGFHVSIEDGQILEVSFSDPGAMLIKKN